MNGVHTGGWQVAEFAKHEVPKNLEKEFTNMPTPFNTPQVSGVSFFLLRVVESEGRREDRPLGVRQARGAQEPGEGVHQHAHALQHPTGDWKDMFNLMFREGSTEAFTRLSTGLAFNYS
jgi:hypothetical protein